MFGKHQFLILLRISNAALPVFCARTDHPMFVCERLSVSITSELIARIKEALTAAVCARIRPRVAEALIGHIPRIAIRDAVVKRGISHRRRVLRPRAPRLGVVAAHIRLVPEALNGVRVAGIVIAGLKRTGTETGG
jgi:hypothetical protein